MATNRNTELARHVTFSLGSEDVERIKQQRYRLTTIDRPLNDSEVVRLGLRLLSKGSSEAVAAALKDLPRFRQGRPRKQRPRRR